MSKKQDAFFIADYSHEIRNPLNAITGLLEIILDTDLDSEQNSIIKNIKQKNHQLQHVLNHMLEYSKLSHGNIKSHPEQLLVFPYLQKILDNLFQIYREKNVRLCYFLPPEISGIVIIDPILTKQVIIEVGKYILEKSNKSNINLEIKVQESNLALEFNYSINEKLIISNAFPANSDKKNISYVFTKSLLKLIGGELSDNETNTLTLKLAIKCTPLIDHPSKESTKDVLRGKNLVFINFQSDTCGSLKKHISYWGMNFHDGGDDFIPNNWKNNDAKYQIIVVDVSNMVTQDFKLIDKIRQVSSLPIILVKEPDNSSQKVIVLQKDVVVIYKPISSKDLALVLVAFIQSKVNDLRELLRNPISLISEYKDNIKILIVDDEAINQRVMTGYFNKLHLKADVASNGKQAVEWYEQQKYDLIFMDINMPEMDGIEATKQIRNMDLQHHPYIIAITADALKGDKEDYKEAGMDDFLFKPVNKLAIQKKISNYIQLIRH